MATTRLVFFVGGAGAGKTTLAKALARRRKMAVLDMDTLLRPAADALMANAGLDPSDRDSDAYKRLCRDLGYRITMDAALENVGNGIDAVVIGPFTKEIADPKWLDQELAKLGEARLTVEVKAIFVYLPDHQHHYERIHERGLAMDRYKLDHWEAFSQSLIRREIDWDLPDNAVLYYNNSKPISEQTLVLLEQFVYGTKGEKEAAKHADLANAGDAPDAGAGTP
ncbi:AAA family ATPase [Paenibacillus sp. MMS18-CY102]|uniref:AAA family ATPase n=1 Tax=Paenibacillus sp. MMS18-CY102 TaxID=2682849 RepID=UPI001365CDAE|nr:AAA family ATPase [Paenibacillus sp. MMS18-CY102]MWC27744.1 AAA family ATPase [Paenibacillus sp. MMS18-CY102]